MQKVFLMRIEEIKEADKDQILALENKVFKDVILDEEGYKALTGYKPSSCYAVWNDNVPSIIVGYVIANHHEKSTLIQKIATHPDFRRQGIGKQLMEKVMLEEYDYSIKNNRPFCLRFRGQKVENKESLKFFEFFKFEVNNQGYGRDNYVLKELPAYLKKEPEKSSEKRGPEESPKKKEFNLDNLNQEFEGLVNEYKKIADKLKEKSLKKTEYLVVASKAETLYSTLEKEFEIFLTDQNDQTFQKFKNNCHFVIKDAKKEFQKHRGIWYQIHPVLRAIVGSISTVTILPALIVAATSKHGYIGTFFSIPKTKSIEKLDKLYNEEKVIEQSYLEVFKPKK
jgi:GNAT superfamily N-acetyltransferase